MKKIFYSVFFALALFMVAAVPKVKAEEDYEITRLVDEADILSDSEEEEIVEQLDDVSEEYDMDIVIATVETLEGYSPKSYAELYYELCEYNEDGMILLISMEDTGGGRDVYIRPMGDCDIDVVTKDGAQYMIDRITPELKDGEYAEACEEYVSLSNQFFEQVEDGGEPYDGSHMPKTLGDWLINGLIALGIGLVIAFLIVNSMRMKLKSVAPNESATDYMRPGSMNVRESKDMFLYRTVSRRAKPKNNSSGGGRSSGGGGAGGKF